MKFHNRKTRFLCLSLSLFLSVCRVGKFLNKRRSKRSRGFISNLGLGFGLEGRSGKGLDHPFPCKSLPDLHGMGTAVEEENIAVDVAELGVDSGGFEKGGICGAAAKVSKTQK